MAIGMYPSIMGNALNGNALNAPIKLDKNKTQLKAAHKKHT